MPPRQSSEQKRTIERAMHEFKHGELPRGRGGKVKNRKQAVAIALHEAGASKYESLQKNRENLRHTKAQERRGLTAGKRAAGRGPTRAQLYEQAKRRKIAGRSKMNKSQLQRALSG